MPTWGSALFGCCHGRQLDSTAVSFGLLYFLEAGDVIGMTHHLYSVITWWAKIDRSPPMHDLVQAVQYASFIRWPVTSELSRKYVLHCRFCCCFRDVRKIDLCSSTHHPFKLPYRSGDIGTFRPYVYPLVVTPQKRTDNLTRNTRGEHLDAETPVACSSKTTEKQERKKGALAVGESNRDGHRHLTHVPSFFPFFTSAPFYIAEKKTHHLTRFSFWFALSHFYSCIKSAILTYYQPLY